MRLFLSFGVVAILSLAAAQAAEVVVEVNGVELVLDSNTDQLIGFNNVIVELESGDQAYDIRFTDGACAEIYGTCETSRFDFQTEGDARAAAVALSSSFDATNGDLQYDFDTERTDIAGCGSSVSCTILLPYVAEGDRFSLTGIYQDLFLDIDGFSSSNNVLISSHDELVALSNSYTYARFTPVDPVPVPAAGVLMIGGLAAVGALSRRRRQGAAA